MIMKSGKHLFHGLVTCQEGVFQGGMLAVITLEKIQKIERIGGLKCAVTKSLKRNTVFFRVIDHELVRRVSHHGKKFGGFRNNGFALTPGQHRRPKRRDFNILAPYIPVWDLDRIVSNEFRPVELAGLAFQPQLQVAALVSGGH